MGCVVNEYNVTDETAEIMRQWPLQKLAHRPYQSAPLHAESSPVPTYSYESSENQYEIPEESL